METPNENIQYSESNLREPDDFWKDANDFLETQIPKDFQDNLLNYAKSKNYTVNEFRLFSYTLKEALTLHSTIVLLKAFPIQEKK